MTTAETMTTEQLADRHGVPRTTITRALARGHGAHRASPTVHPAPPEPVNPGGRPLRFDVAAMDAWWPQRPGSRASAVRTAQQADHAPAAAREGTEDGIPAAHSTWIAVRRAPAGDILEPRFTGPAGPHGNEPSARAALRDAVDVLREAGYVVEELPVGKNGLGGEQGYSEVPNADVPDSFTRPSTPSSSHPDNAAAQEAHRAPHTSRSHRTPIGPAVSAYSDMHNP